MTFDRDLVIVGFGSGGMFGAELAARLGIRVTVVERGRPGGDCLWTGCVPSKTLLASAKVAHTLRTADRYGLPSSNPEIDTGRVWARIRKVRDEIAGSDDDPARFEAMGVEVLHGQATITGPHEVTVDGTTRRSTRYVLLCTGSHPAVPPIDGLGEAGFLTSETIFELDRAPESVVVVGGGPVAVEMAQGLTRLGVPATVVEMARRILPRDEPALVDRLEQRLLAEGVGVHTGVAAQRVTIEDGRKVVQGTGPNGLESHAAAEILVAAGRVPVTDGLGLEEVGVETTRLGVVVDRRLRTTVPSIYAAGDLIGRERFTHAAAYHAGMAIRDMFLPGPARVDEPIPWVTFTDPELAHLGPTSVEAEDLHGDRVRVWEQPLAGTDRGRAESVADGAIVLVTRGRDLLGAHILAPTAGELVGEAQVAMAAGMKTTRFASLVRAYPTWSTGMGQAAGEAAGVLIEKLGRLARLSRP